MEDKYKTAISDMVINPNSNETPNRHGQNMPTSLQKTRRSLNKERKETVPMYQAVGDE